MPKVNALVPDQKVQQQLEKLTREVKIELMDNGISYTALAKYLNKTPQAVSQQFKKGNHITIEVLIASKMLINDLGENKC